MLKHESLKEMKSQIEMGFKEGFSASLENLEAFLKENQ